MFILTLFYYCHYIYLRATAYIFALHFIYLYRY